METLCILAADSDSAVRDRAADILLTQPLKYVISALARPNAAAEMFAYCAAEFPRRPGVADALAARLPATVLGSATQPSPQGSGPLPLAEGA